MPVLVSGQTLYHDGLLVERDGGDALFFLGDSFTPSGMDDYCLQNRNFLRDGAGFLYCLRVLERLPANVWMVNEHVEPTFRFSKEQLQRMRAELASRMALLRELAPWPDLNYAIDENWAAIHPYGSRVRNGEQVRLELRILNHSPQTEVYGLAWNLPAGWKVIRSDESVAVPARKEAVAHVLAQVAGTGLQVVTVDLEFAGTQLREWTEALVRVEP